LYITDAGHLREHVKMNRAEKSCSHRTVSGFAFKA
jgi:hypothetical protein